jgi:hypothetical protein
LSQKDEVNAFLLRKGVESTSLGTDKFKVTEQKKDFVRSDGKTFECGYRLKISRSEGSETCPLSRMKDLYTKIKESNKREL